jgi:hypothetical protein
VVYSKEKHASDRFPSYLTNRDEWSVPTQLTERARRWHATKWASTVKVKSSILIDNLNDDAARVFAAMPQRLYIIRDQKVWWRSPMDDSGYSIPAAAQALQAIPTSARSWAERFVMNIRSRAEEESRILAEKARHAREHAQRAQHKMFECLDSLHAQMEKKSNRKMQKSQVPMPVDLAEAELSKDNDDPVSVEQSDSTSCSSVEGEVADGDGSADFGLHRNETMPYFE